MLFADLVVVVAVGTAASVTFTVNSTVTAAGLLVWALVETLRKRNRVRRVPKIAFSS